MPNKTHEYAHKAQQKTCTGLFLAKKIIKDLFNSLKFIEYIIVLLIKFVKKHIYLQIISDRCYFSLTRGHEMDRKNSLRKRLLALVLSLAMTIVYMPASVTAFAADGDLSGANEQSIEETTDGSAGLSSDAAGEDAGVDSENEDDQDQDLFNESTSESSIDETLSADNSAAADTDENTAAADEDEAAAEDESLTGEGSEEPDAESERLTNNSAYTIFAATDRHASTQDVINVVTAAENYVESEYQTSISKTIHAGDLVNSGDASTTLDGFTSLSGLAAVNAEFRSVLTWLSEDGADNFYTYGDTHDKSVSTGGVANRFLDSAGKSGSTSPARDTGAKELGSWGYLWGIDHFEMTDTSKAASAASEFTSWVNSLPADDRRVIIIASHVPLHSRRGDNKGAATWLTAINNAAENKDIFFFWGHNHTEWDTTDQSASFVEPGGSITPQGGNSTVINFTYSLGGYIGKSATNGWRGSTVTVTKDKLYIDHYSTTAHLETKTIDRKDLYEYAKLSAEDILVARNVGGNVAATIIEYIFTVDGAASSDITFTIKEDPDFVIDSISNTGEITFTGNTGTATVTVTGSYTEDGETREISDDITVTVEPYVVPLKYGYSSAAEAGLSYVIVSNGYAMVNNDGELGAVKVEESDDKITVTDSDVSESSILWTVGKDGSLSNGSYYVRRSSGSDEKTLTLDTSTADKYTNWSYANDQISVKGRNNSTYYIYYNGSWKTNTSTSYTAKLYGHIPDFKVHSLILSGQIGVNFFMDLPDTGAVDYSESYMEFTVNGLTHRADFDDSFKNTSGEYYGFRCYVNSIQMAEPITAVFHYGDGQTVSETYSVDDYIEKFKLMVSSGEVTDEKMIAVVKSLADYGHYIQPFLSDVRGWTIGTDYAEMSTHFTDTYDHETISKAASDYAIIRNHNDPDISAISYQLSLDSETEIYVLFRPADNYAGEFSFTVDGQATVPKKMSDGRYRVDISGISAHKLGNTYTVVATTENGSATVKVSAISYVNTMYETYSDDCYRNAAASLYKYYDAARTYKEG